MPPSRLFDYSITVCISCLSFNLPDSCKGGKKLLTESLLFLVVRGRRVFLSSTYVRCLEYPSASIVGYLHTFSLSLTHKHFSLSLQSQSRYPSMSNSTLFSERKAHFKYVHKRKEGRKKLLLVCKTRA